MFLVVSSLCTTLSGRSGLIKRPSSLIARALLRLTLSAEISRVSLLGTTKGRDLREDTASHWHTRCTSELFGTNWPPKVSSKFEAKRIVVKKKKQLISHSNWIHCIQHIHTTASYSHCQCSVLSAKHETIFRQQRLRGPLDVDQLTRIHIHHLQAKADFTQA